MTVGGLGPIKVSPDLTRLPCINQDLACGSADRSESIGSRLKSPVQLQSGMVHKANRKKRRGKKRSVRLCVSDRARQQIREDKSRGRGVNMMGIRKQMRAKRDAAGCLQQTGRGSEDLNNHIPRSV